MITSIAWKNVWRNRTRSLTVIAAVTVGVFAGVFAMAAINSSIVQRIDAAVNEELSHIQINSKEFRSSSDLKNVIPEPEKVISVLQNIPEVTRIAERIIVRGIASTSAGSTGVEITGINVGGEEEMFTLRTRLIPGTGPVSSWRQAAIRPETRFARGMAVVSALQIVQPGRVSVSISLGRCRSSISA